jgi:competence protein ComEC
LALAYISIAWIIGDYFGSLDSLPPFVFLAGFIPFVIIPFLKKHKTSLLIAGFCLFALLGSGVRFQSNLPVLDEYHINYYNDGPDVELEAVITSYPDVRDRNLRFHVSALRITSGGEERDISGNAIVRASRYPELCYGNVLKIKGKLETPQKYGEFDYKEYLYRHDIYSVINFPQIEVLDRDNGSSILSIIYAVRGNLAQSLSRALPEPQCALAQGMFLGIRSSIPSSLQEAFSNTGTTHVLAISGLNLSIIMGIFLSIGLGLFGRRYNIHIWLVLLIIWFYALVTSMSPPIIRSAIMGSVFLAGELLGRQRSTATALVFAAAVMVGIEPQALWDISFQLSFLSMVGLIFVFPYIQTWGREKASLNIGKEGIVASICRSVIDGGAVTFSAILATLPIIVYNFGTISLVSLPANLMALPSVPAIIALSGLVALLGLFSPALAFVIALVDWLFISYFIIVIQAFNAVPFASVRLESIQTWQICLYYLFFVMLMIIINYRAKLATFSSVLLDKMRFLIRNISDLMPRLPKKWFILPMVVICALICIAVFYIPDNRMHVNILDVGQGEAILIQAPGNQKILVDGGPSPQAIKLALGKKLPFWDRTIDLIVVTQPQADHITGLIEVCKQYNVKNVYDAGLYGDSILYTQWYNTVKERKINFSTVYRGKRINIGDSVYMDVLNPQDKFSGQYSSNVNNNSMVLHLYYQKVSFLFTSDISKDTELELLASGVNLKSTVLKVAHHGGKDSTSQQFIEVVAPEAAAISVGKGNNYGHPHPDVIARLSNRVNRSNIFLTSEDGSIEFITDGYKLLVKTDKGK